jgi:hypothetical protein
LESYTQNGKLKIELLCLRAALVPRQQITTRERKLIEQGRREIEKDRYVTLGQLRKELGVE